MCNNAQELLNILYRNLCLCFNMIYMIYKHRITKEKRLICNIFNVNLNTYVLNKITFFFKITFIFLFFLYSSKRLLSSSAFYFNVSPQYYSLIEILPVFSLRLRFKLTLRS